MTQPPPQEANTRVFHVAVGSTNPAKIRAVEQCLQRATAERTTRHTNVDFCVRGVQAPSQVPDQPFGDAETCQGAKNRARAAFVAFRKEYGFAPHLSVGMEGGLERRRAIAENNGTITNSGEDDDNDEEELYCMAWMAIFGRRVAATVDIFASMDTSTYYGDKKAVFGLSKTASFALPTRVSELVLQKGMELGDADDVVFDRVKSKHGSGTVGILTDGLIDRAHYYEHALIMALTPWIRPDLYPHGMR